MLWAALLPLLLLSTFIVRLFLLGSSMNLRSSIPLDVVGGAGAGVGVERVVFMLSRPVETKLEQSVPDADVREWVVAGRTMLERALAELSKGESLVLSSGLVERLTVMGVFGGWSVETLSLTPVRPSAFIVEPRDLSVEGKEPPPPPSSSDPLDSPLSPVKDKLICALLLLCLVLL